MKKKLQISIGLLLFVAIMAAQIYVIFAPSKNVLNWYTTDDAFYYFKVARNITEGKGVTFDGVNPTNGFHPLWMLICIPIFALARFDPYLPLRGIMLVSIMFSAGTSLLIYKILKRLISKEASLLAAIFYAFYKTVHVTTVEGGMEAGVCAFFIALLVYLAMKWESENPIGSEKWTSLAWVGLAGAFTVLSRLDNVFLVGMVGAWLALRSFRNRSLLILDALAIVGAVLYSFQTRLTGIGFSSFTDSAMIMIAASLLSRVVIYYLAGLYQHPKTYSIKSYILRLALASLAASVFTTVVMLVTGAFHLYINFFRLVLPIEGVISLFFAAMLRLAYIVLVPAKENDHHPFPLLNWKHAFRTCLAYFLPVGIILVVYMGYNYLTIGTFTPISGQVKHWWSTLDSSVYPGVSQRALDYAGYSLTGPWEFATSLFKGAFTALFGRNASETVMTLTSILVTALLLSLIWLGRKKVLAALNGALLAPLIAGSTLQIMYYSFSGYSTMRYWYWVGQIFVIVLALGILLDALYGLLRRLPGRSIWPRLLTAGVGIILLITFVNRIARLNPAKPGGRVAEAYLTSIESVRNLTQPGDIIASPGAGYLGYFLDDRTVINLDGLINSREYFNDLKTGNVPAFLEEMKVKYVYGSSYMLNESQPYASFFKGHLKRIQQAGDQVLFQYISPSK